MDRVSDERVDPDGVDIAGRARGRAHWPSRKHRHGEARGNGAHAAGTRRCAGVPLRRRAIVCPGLERVGRRRPQRVTAIAVSGTDLYVGGFFTDARGSQRPTGSPSGTEAPGPRWARTGLAMARSALPGPSMPWPSSGATSTWGGSFNTPWASLRPTTSPGGTGRPGPLSAPTTGRSTPGSTLAASGTDLYVGGGFTDAGGISIADHIVRWTGLGWSDLGSNGSVGALNGDVFSLAALGLGLFVGGSFTDAGGIATTDYVASFIGATWAGLGSDGAGNGALPDQYSPSRWAVVGSSWAARSAMPRAS